MTTLFVEYSQKNFRLTLLCCADRYKEEKQRSQVQLVYIDIWQVAVTLTVQYFQKHEEWIPDFCSQISYDSSSYYSLKNIQAFHRDLESLFSDVFYEQCLPGDHVDRPLEPSKD